MHPRFSRWDSTSSSQQSCPKVDEDRVQARRFPLTLLRPPFLLTILVLACCCSLQNQSVTAQEKPAELIKKPKLTDLYGDPLPEGAIARLGTVRFRHNAWISFTAFSPDGKLLATSATDRTVCVWTFPSGERYLQHPLLVDTYAVNSLAISPDSKLLAIAAGPDTSNKLRAFYLVDIATGKEVRRFVHGPEGPIVTTLAFSSDGNQIVSGGTDKTIRLWSVSSGKEVGQFEGHEQGVRRVVFSPDGRLLASGSTDLTVRIWETVTGKLLHTLRGHQTAVTSLDFSADGTQLATGGAGDVSIITWDPKTGQEVRRLQGSKEGADFVAFLKEDKTLISGTRSGIVHRWDLTTGKQLQENNLDGAGMGFSLSPDGKTIATGTANRYHAVRLWDATSGKEIVAHGGHRNAVNFVTFSPDDKKIISASNGYTVRVWDLLTGKETNSLKQVQSIASVALSPDSKVVALVNADQTIHLWDLVASKKIGPIPRITRAIYCLAFSPDGKALAAASRMSTDNAGHAVYILEAATGKELQSLPASDYPIRTLAFSPNGKTLAWKSGMVHLWDVTTARQLRPLQPRENRAWSLAFSSDSKIMASATSDDTINLWEVSTGKLIRNFEGGFEIALSPDGRTLASGNRAGVVRLWDLASGKELFQRKGHTSSVLSLAFSHDGAKLASGSSDTTVVVWDVVSLLNREPVSKDHLSRTPADLWDELAYEHAGAGYSAVWRLVAYGDKSVPIIKDRLEPFPKADQQRIDQLIAELDSDKAVKREGATTELDKLGAEIEPALRRAIQGKLSLEATRRLDSLLDAIHKNPLSPETVRRLRAIKVLELIGSKEARQHLEKLSLGSAYFLQTEDAKAALERLDRWQEKRPHKEF